MNSETNQIAKIKIKPLRYTLMELREINFLKRKGRPIPPELLNKPFEDFDVGNKLKPKKEPIPKIVEIKENKDESSDLSNTIKEQEQKNLDNNKIDEKKKNDSESKKSSSNANDNDNGNDNDNDNGIFKLKLFNAGEDDENKSSNNENEE